LGKAFEAALSEATATLERDDQRALLAALERLTEAVQALADSLRATVVR
jgi:hypothetical protein